MRRLNEIKKMTFLEKYELLKKSIPVPAVFSPYTIDCEYVDNTIRSKNCYYCFDSVALEDSMYSTIGWGNKLVDCILVIESEKCYQSIDSNKCNSCSYLMDCNSCTACHFSAFLNNCTDCFGCVALTHKKYCILNIQYTKEDYIKRVRELKKEMPEKILEQLFEIKLQTPHPASQQINSENSAYGNYIYNSKNCYWSFNSQYCENSGYMYVGTATKNCWDIANSGKKGYLTGVLGERCYELVHSGPSLYDCAFLQYSEFCTNCYYGTNIKNCSDCFGCVGLNNKKYCILNNQLTKEQYIITVNEIKKELGWKI